MSVKFRLTGGSNTVAAVETHDRHNPGLMVYTHPMDHYAYGVQFLTNPTYGADLTVNPSAEGITEDIIHNGGDAAYWTASNLVGQSFVFNSTTVSRTGLASIDASNTANNDTASFTTGVPELFSQYSSFRMYVYITSFPSTGTKDITVQLLNGGAPVGNELSIKPYVNTLTLNTWQLVDIPIGDFNNIDQLAVDELRIKTVDSGRGTPPAYYVDDISLVQTSTSTGVESYRYEPDYGINSSLLKLRLLAYNSAAANADPTKFFGLPALSNGIELVLRNGKRVFLSLIARDIWDMIRLGNAELKVVSDGATGATYYIEFAIPLEHMLINGSEGTFVELRIRDDLTSLSRFECTLHLATLQD